MRRQSNPKPGHLLTGELKAKRGGPIVDEAAEEIDYDLLDKRQWEMLDRATAWEDEIRGES